MSAVVDRIAKDAHIQDNREQVMEVVEGEWRSSCLAIVWLVLGHASKRCEAGRPEMVTCWREW
jgi:hypothetical protein